MICQVMETVRKEVLKGCKIVFTGVIPLQSTPQHHSLWIMAEQLGATCSINVDSSVTHVVAVNAGTAKSCWAVKNKKFLVNPKWLEASKFLWRKQPEDEFRVHHAQRKMTIYAASCLGLRLERERERKSERGA